MTKPAVLARILEQELFWLQQACGPESNKKVAFFPNGTYSSSSDTPDVPYLIPDVCYHPEIYATVDFTHTFVVSSEKLTGKRLVPDEILRSAALKLQQFFGYYFQYAYTYAGSLKERSSATNIRSLMVKGWDDLDPQSLSLFLNYIINYFITSVNVNRSVSDISSCTVSLKDNPNWNKRGIKSNLFFNSMQSILNQVFVPMLPIKVWARGRLYSDWYFPIFDGYIMRAAPGDSAGFTSLDISCRDTLELARISAEMINPAIIQVEEHRQQSNLNIFSKPLYGIDHMEIFNKLFHGGSLVYDPKQERLRLDEDVLSNLRKDRSYLKFDSLGSFQKANEDTETVTPESVADDRAIHKDVFSLGVGLQKTMHKNQGQRFTVNWGYRITPYRTFGIQGFKSFTSEFSSRLDILRDVAGMAYFELYVDGNGNVQYHPMRLANAYINHDIIYKNKSGEDIYHKLVFPGVNVVGPEEQVNISRNLNVEELTTFLRLSGKPPVELPAPNELLDLVGSFRDDNLLRRFGYRRKDVSNDLFNSNPDITTTNGKKVKFMKLAAASLLRFMNAELYTSEATIIFRPELELATPVYMYTNKEVFYIQSINHSITIGGDATTTISSNFGRKSIERPPDLANFMIASQKLYNLSGKAYVTETDSETRSENRFDIGTVPPVDEWVDNEVEELFDAYQKDLESPIVAFSNLANTSETAQAARKEAQKNRQIEDLRKALTLNESDI